MTAIHDELRLPGRRRPTRARTAVRRTRVSQPGAALGRNCDGSKKLAHLLGHVRGYLDVTPEEVGYILVALAVAVARALDEEEPLWVILAGRPAQAKPKRSDSWRSSPDGRVDE
jgi:hypothetical protein